MKAKCEVLVGFPEARKRAECAGNKYSLVSMKLQLVNFESFVVKYLLPTTGDLKCISTTATPILQGCFTFSSVLLPI